MKATTLLTIYTFGTSYVTAASLTYLSSAAKDTHFDMVRPQEVINLHARGLVSLIKSLVVSNEKFETEDERVARLQSDANKISTRYNCDNYKINNMFEVHYRYSPQDRPIKSPASFLPSGEDNFFLTKVTSKGNFAVGVTTGLSEGLPSDEDSSAISRELCHEAKKLFEKGDEQLMSNPKVLLKAAEEKIQDDKKVKCGKTSPLFAIFSKDQLKIASLGASWAGLFRNGKLIEMTNPTYHPNDEPYSLCKLDTGFGKKIGLTPDNYKCETWQDSIEYSWKTQSNDFLVFFSEGVYKSIEPEMIEKVVETAATNDGDASYISSQILFHAQQGNSGMNDPSGQACQRDDMLVMAVEVK